MVDCNKHKRFSEVIKELRKKRRLTQRALAKMLGVSPGYVGQWEVGLSKPSTDIVRRICTMFEIAEEERLQTLAYAETAPSYVRASIMEPTSGMQLSEQEIIIIRTLRELSQEKVEIVMQQIRILAPAGYNTNAGD